jgi:hypothetical protein
MSSRSTVHLYLADRMVAKAVVAGTANTINYIQIHNSAIWRQHIFD